LKDLTKGNLLNNLLTYSLPILLGDLLQSLYSTVDALWVGRLIGADALAAVSASMPIMFLLVSLMIGIAVSTVILCGQAYGAKNFTRLQVIIENSFIVLSIMSVAISALGIIFSTPLLRLLNTPESILPQAHTFLVIILAGQVFMFFYNWLSGILRGLGDSRTPLKLLAISVSLNIILAPALISGFMGVPRMGIAGSALATVISQFITALIAVFFIIKKYEFFDVRKWKFKFDSAVIRQIFFIGIPVSLQMIITSLSGVVIISIVNRFGPDVTAGFGIGMRIDQFSFLPAMSIGMAVSAFTAQFLGAKKHEGIKKIIGYAVIYSACISAVMFIVVNLAGRQIAGIFTSSAAVIEHSVIYFRYVSFTYILFSVYFIFLGTIRGAGDTLPSTIISFISLLMVRATMAHYLSESMGEQGIWIAMLASVATALILTYIYYLSGRWIKVYEKNESRRHGAGHNQPPPASIEP